jgi:hypothetical protein
LSKAASATIADRTRDPAAYDRLASYERALREYGAEVLEALGQPPAKPSRTNGRPRDLGKLAALELGVDAATSGTVLEPRE